MIGVRLYDLFCRKHNEGRSSNLSTSDLARLLPQLDLDQSSGGVRYFDHFTNDARLVMDTLKSASDHGATLCNYMRLTGAIRNEDGWSCELENRLTGEIQAIQCRGIMNASGVWSPELAQSKVQLRPTKGVHLVINRKRLEVPSAVVLTDESRVLFLVPWGDRTILGTTDTDYSGSLENPVCDTDDLEYILANVRAYFPRANIQKSDVLSTWAGIRPLVADSHGNPSEISRRHEIHMAEPGWWDVTGGKLTTYRLIAEQAVDSVVRHLDVPAKTCATATSPLLRNAPHKTAYSGCRPPEVTRELVEYYVAHEWAVHLDDVMIRRSSWCHYLEDPLHVAKDVSAWMAKPLGWSSDQQAKELARYEEIHRQFRGCL